MTKARASRATRVVLKSPTVRDRVFVRRTHAETADWFDRILLHGGEVAFLQVYLPKDGWHIMKSRGSA